ncbi:TPA: hypothetical protein ACH3X1_013582 [Trebouxia sp. C0004]
MASSAAMMNTETCKDHAGVVRCSDINLGVHLGTQLLLRFQQYPAGVFDHKLRSRPGRPRSAVQVVTASIGMLQKHQEQQRTCAQTMQSVADCVTIFIELNRAFDLEASNLAEAHFLQ